MIECVIFLYREKKILIRLNIFDSKDFQISLLIQDFLEDLLESILDPKFTIHPEDFRRGLLMHYLLENLSPINSKLKITSEDL